MDDQDDFTETDATLVPLIAATPGASPNDLASFALAGITGNVPPPRPFRRRPNPL
jgi:hypothetical protein